MNKLNKALVGTAAAAAMAVSATPAMAKNSRHHDNGISAGEVIAGAVVLGGLAAILTSGKKDRYNSNRDYRGGRDYRGSRDGYRNGRYSHSDYGNGRYGQGRIAPRRAVNKCIRAAERRAGHYGTARVTDVRDVKRTRYGYKVKGRIAVNNNYRANNRGRHYRSNYNRGHNRGYDQGKFTCYVEGRRISDLRLKGLGNYR